MKNINTFLWFLLSAMLLVGCQDETPSSGKAANSEANQDAVINQETGYLPVFDTDHPQNTISSRMQHNIAKYGAPNELETVAFPPAGIRLHKPKSLEISDKFIGFSNVLDGVAGGIKTNPFSREMTAGIINGTLRAPYIKVMYSKAVEFDGKKGDFYLTKRSQGEVSISQFLVTFGDDDFSWVVTYTLPSDKEAQYAPEILKSIFNIQVSEEVRTPPGQDVDFVLSSDSFQLTDGFIGKLVLTIDGNFPIAANSQMPVFQAEKLPLPFPEEADTKAIATRLRAPSPEFRINHLSGEKEVTIDGIEGHESISIATDMVSGAPLMIYSAVLFDESKYGYVFHGWAHTGNDENYIDDFRAILNSFKRKNKGTKSQENNSNPN